MTYPVFLYNMLLAATYVVLAVVFFWAAPFAVQPSGVVAHDPVRLLVRG